MRFTKKRLRVSSENRLTRLRYNTSHWTLQLHSLSLFLSAIDSPGQICSGCTWASAIFISLIIKSEGCWPSERSTDPVGWMLCPSGEENSQSCVVLCSQLRWHLSRANWAVALPDHSEWGEASALHGGYRQHSCWWWIPRRRLRPTVSEQVDCPLCSVLSLIWLNTTRLCHCSSPYTFIPFVPRRNARTQSIDF